ncbi:hypothetical protein [Nostoc sp.]|uniref:hypothetical protein n=1 Tax=Nostoc sp. TaxID=1180 RepID=UPI002FF823DB
MIISQLSSQLAADFNRERKRLRALRMKRVLGVLQITLSLCGVMMFGTVTYAAINMVNGQYQVEIMLNTKGLKIKSDIDKRQCKAVEDIAQKHESTNSDQKRIN